MSIQSVKVMVPPSAAMPRGSRWASSLVIGLTDAGRRVWQALERVGQARAQRELRSLVERHAAGQPELAQTFRDAMNRAAMHRDSQP